MLAHVVPRQAYVAARLRPDSQGSGRGEGPARKLRVASAGAGTRRRGVLDEMKDDWSDEQTNDPLVADVRNFYKIEKWTRGN